jgi:hypothetical protein
MKISNKSSNFFNYLWLVIAWGLSSCTRNARFTPSELAFVKPFTKINTAVFQSDLGQMDTIIFYAARFDTLRVRNFSSGFYNQDILTVKYQLSPRSFHQFIGPHDNSTPIDFISFSKVKSSYENKEIFFLGLSISEDYAKYITENATIDYSKAISFERRNAQYTGMNINQGIQSFVFSFTEGIKSYIGENGVKWRRVN